VADAIAEDPGVRIPGVPRRRLDPVDVPDALWERTLALGGGPA
jgi:hypothetical protein